MIWFSADFHLSHNNIIGYCRRPFKTVEKMDKTIVENLINRVKSKDTLYFLGDLTFKSLTARKFFEHTRDLQIHFIIGNHDSNRTIQIAKEYCLSVSHLKDINLNGQFITLCHYAMRVWNKSHYNAWQLYGHSHGGLFPNGKQYDVGVDTNQFHPVSLDALKEIMKRKGNNFNYIPRAHRRR